MCVRCVDESRVLSYEGVYVSGCVFRAEDLEPQDGHLRRKTCFTGSRTLRANNVLSSDAGETSAEVGQMSRLSVPLTAVTVVTRCSHHTCLTVI